MPLFKFLSKCCNVVAILDVKGRLFILPCEGSWCFALIVHRIWGNLRIDLDAEVECLTVVHTIYV